MPKRRSHWPTALADARWPSLLVQLGMLSLGCVALLWPALHNGYPLAFQDSNWYLQPVFGGQPHPGRAVGYSLLAFVARPLASIWPLAVVQALITSALLVRVAFVAAGRWQHGMALSSLALAAVLLLSGAAKYASWVMADVTTGWLFLAGALFLLSNRRGDRAAALAVLALAVLGHNSHVPLVLATSAAVAAGALLLPGVDPRARRSCLLLLGVALACVPGSLAVNAALGERASVFRGASSFLVHRFIDTGVLERTLDRYCDERDWAACEHRAALREQIGRGGGWFLFHPDSPFRGELGGWLGEEQGELVAHAFRCCAGRIAATTALGSWRQLLHVDSRDGVARRDTRPLLTLLRAHVPREVAQLERSRQHRGLPVRVVLHPVPEAALHVLLLLAALALGIEAWRRDARRAAFLLAGLLVFLLANAAICSLGAPLFDRYQGRVAWLLPYGLTIAAWWRLKPTAPASARSGAVP